ncbi:MAG: hypothetical protein ABIF40_02110 [archaeon]
MAKKKLEIDELIYSIVGPDVEPLVELLIGKQNISEFKLAEKLNITVNQVRNMLYKLYDHNLVTFIRRKDKKKGWYIYYWTLNDKNIKYALVAFKKKQLENFKSRVNNESAGTFFVCPNRCLRLSIEKAMEQDFRCDECGSLMVQQDNKRTLENLKQRIIELEKDVEAFEEGQREIKMKVLAKIEREKKLEEKLEAELEAKVAAKLELKKKREVRKKELEKKRAEVAKKKMVLKTVVKKKPVKKNVVKKKPVKKTVVKKEPVKKTVVKKESSSTLAKRPKKKSLMKKFVRKITKKRR